MVKLLIVVSLLISNSVLADIGKDSPGSGECRVSDAEVVETIDDQGAYTVVLSAFRGPKRTNFNFRIEKAGSKERNLCAKNGISGSTKEKFDFFRSAQLAGRQVGFDSASCSHAFASTSDGPHSVGLSFECLKRFVVAKEK